ncbi:unnamed protein product [Rhizopus stolonifer]
MSNFLKTSKPSETSNQQNLKLFSNMRKDITTSSVAKKQRLEQNEPNIHDHGSCSICGVLLPEESCRHCTPITLTTHNLPSFSNIDFIKLYSKKKIKKEGLNVVLTSSREVPLLQKQEEIDAPRRTRLQSKTLSIISEVKMKNEEVKTYSLRPHRMSTFRVNPFSQLYKPKEVEKKETPEKKESEKKKEPEKKDIMEKKIPKKKRQLKRKPKRSLNAKGIIRLKRLRKLVLS